MTDVSRGSILLVDDDDLVLRSLSMALGDAGFNVTTADNGRFAVELCEGEVFDVVCDMACRV
jgi:CheY-like chemotaxis protein